MEQVLIIIAVVFAVGVGGGAIFVTSAARSRRKPAPSPDRPSAAGQSGGTATLEAPDVFNQAVDRFLSTLALGAWRERDPRSVSDSATGMS